LLKSMLSSAWPLPAADRTRLLLASMLRNPVLLGASAWCVCSVLLRYVPALLH
jgi:hypothetical protein